MSGPRAGAGSLRGQMLLLVLATLVLAQLVAAALFLDERGRALRFAQAQEAVARSALLADRLDRTADADRPAVLASARERGVRLSVDSAPLATPAAGRPLGRMAGRIGRDMAPARGLGLVAAQGRDGRPETLVVSLRLADGQWLNGRWPARRPPLQWAWPALASLLLTGAALAAVVWVALGRLLRPVRDLADAAEALGRGDRPGPVPVRGPDEIRQLTARFNEMATRLGALLEARARTLAAIGHDLRSPLTAMRLRSEMVEDDETRERLGVCIDEIETLTEAALALARAEGGGAEPRGPVALAPLLAELAEAAGGPVTLDAGAAPVTVSARPVALRAALRNLVENALRYGGAARLALTAEAGRARVTVDDDGPGVPEDMREAVFDPFVRLEGSRSRDTGGSGLGLAIARAAIRAEGGDAWIEAAPGGGARAVVVLPLADGRDRG